MSNSRKISKINDESQPCSIRTILCVDVNPSIVHKLSKMKTELRTSNGFSIRLRKARHSISASEQNVN